MTEDYLIDELEQQELSIAEAERILLELEDILNNSSDSGEKNDAWDSSIYLESRIDRMRELENNKTILVEEYVTKNKELEKEIKELKINLEYYKKIKGEQVSVLTKNDIMHIFDVKSEKALLILKYLFQQKKGVMIGKSYYTDQKGLEFIFNDMPKRQMFTV